MAPDVVKMIHSLARIYNFAHLSNIKFILVDRIFVSLSMVAVVQFLEFRSCRCHRCLLLFRGIYIYTAPFELHSIMYDGLIPKTDPPILGAYVFSLEYTKYGHLIHVSY
jgi:hypothetical protein